MARLVLIGAREFVEGEEGRRFWGARSSTAEAFER
jgi:hypothetical protein